MARQVFKTDLSVKGIEKLKKDLLRYKKVELPQKIKRYVEELANEGYPVRAISKKLGITWDEFEFKLKQSGVPKEKIKTLRKEEN